MERSETPDEVKRGNSDDLPVRAKFLQDLDRDGIRRIIELRHNHAVVGEIEVTVARWQPLTVMKLRLGQR